MPCSNFDSVASSDFVLRVQLGGGAMYIWHTGDIGTCVGYLQGYAVY